MNILKIENINVSINDKLILKDFSLTIKSGEIHAIMGPNGTGKSTLSKVIMGSPEYKIESGEIFLNNINLNKLSTSERARLGIFLGMQMPLELDGVTNSDFLRAAQREIEGKPVSLFKFINELEDNIKDLKMDPEMAHRTVNRGFSGGERKKNEILQMNILKPKMVLLDEIDSGLDVDALKLVGESVTKYHEKMSPGILLITHYQRLLDYIKPDYIHIMADGKIVKSGDISLVAEIENEGYAKYEKKEVKKINSIGVCGVKEVLKNE